MIYQHVTSEADRAIADALNAAVKAHNKKAKKTRKKGKGRKPKPDSDAQG